MIAVLIPILVLAVLLVLVAVVILAVALLVVAGAGVSVLLGGIAAIFRPTRWIAPVFLFIVPFVAVGAVAGFFVLGGLLLFGASGLLALLGPIIGLVAGAAIGATAGTILAALTWSVMSANRRARVARA